jgi:hypothetical protein
VVHTYHPKFDAKVCTSSGWRISTYSLLVALSYRNQAATALTFSAALCYLAVAFVVAPATRQSKAVLNQGTWSIWWRRRIPLRWSGERRSGREDVLPGQFFSGVRIFARQGKRQLYRSVSIAQIAILQLFHIGLLVFK